MIRRMVPTTCSACLACNSEVGTKFHINGTFRRDSTHGSRPLPSVVFRASRGAAELTQNGFWEMGARLSQEVAVGIRARSSITNCRRSCSESARPIRRARTPFAASWNETEHPEFTTNKCGSEKR
jgi:hypothetical protein